MAQKKVGEDSRNTIITRIIEALKGADYEVLQVGSASYAIPIVEDEEESAVKIVFQIPKGERGGEGYDPYEDAQAYQFKQEEARKKAEKRAADKARKLAQKAKKEGE